MHELGITQGILDDVVEAAEKQGAARINEISVNVGELTEVVEYALQFTLESLTQDTMAEGASSSSTIIAVTLALHAVWHTSSSTTVRLHVPRVREPVRREHRRVANSRSTASTSRCPTTARHPSCNREHRRHR